MTTGQLKLISVVGARPQFVKLAPVSRALLGRTDVTHRVVHTGQHYDNNMSDTFFSQLEIDEPDLNLGVGSGSHAAQTASMLTALETYLDRERPGVVLTYGDTNSTLAATLAAAKIHLPVAHVEAGLRSFNRAMPEEINRLVADHCSDRLYAPTPAAMANLQLENLARRAMLSGDIMMDAVRHNIELARTRSRALEELGLEPGNFGLVTIHRPANTVEPVLRRLLAALERAAQQHFRLIFPVHPRTRAALEEIGYRPSGRLEPCEPLSYQDNLALIEAAAVVITDSGGIQKEAAFLGTPCLTARDETEWTETVDIGVNRLVGYGGEKLVVAMDELLSRGKQFDEVQLSQIERHYGSGDAARKIIADCVESFS